PGRGGRARYAPRRTRSDGRRRAAQRDRRSGGHHRLDRFRMHPQRRRSPHRGGRRRRRWHDGVMDRFLTHPLDRRSALVLGPVVGLAGLLAACGAGSGPGTGGSAGAAAATTPAAGPDAALSPALRALAARAPLCVPTADTTEGPYWFDVDEIRSDLREDRTGVTARVALRVQDLGRCGAEPDGAGLPGVAVEIWHCDAAGVYSGYEAGSRAAAGGPDAPPPPPAPEPGDCTVSRGQY